MKHALNKGKMRPGPKIQLHHMKATVGVQSKSKQTHSTIGLNEVQIKFEFYKRCSKLEKKLI